MKMRGVTKWISRITTTILFTVLLLMVFMVVSSKMSGGSVFGYQLKTVLSGSMEPGIHTGSIIAVKPTHDVTNFLKGDVVTFKADEHELVTHRVFKVKNDGQQYVTKGDNNNAPDMDPLLAQNIVAEYTGFTIPYVGYAVHYASTKIGTALLLILPGILLLCYSGVTIWRTLKEIESNVEKKPTVETK